MTYLPIILSVALAGVALAGTVAPNKPYDGPITSEGVDKTLAISPAPSVGETTTMVLTAQLTFTLPTESPAYDEEVRASKLAITADRNGTILVADGTTNAWVSSEYTVADGGTVQMRAEGKLNAEGKLAFKVTFSPVAAANSAVDASAVKTVSVVSPAATTILNNFTFSGEGETADLTLALVDTAILPPAAEGDTQDPALVEKYVVWLNDEAKGGALAADATDGDKQDAFAMNAGGVPNLTITAIDPAGSTITVKGSYTAAGGEAPVVDLKAINGVLTIASRESLGGTETIQKVNISAAANGKAVKVPFPQNARFVKAAVSVNPPANATGESVNAQ